MAIASPTTDQKLIPGPRRLPGAAAYWRYFQFFRDPLRMIRQHYAHYGALSGIFNSFEAGQPGTLLAIGPQYNQLLLSDPQTFYSPDLAERKGGVMERLSTGLVFENGDRHRQHRRLVMPAFHKKHIEGYRDDMVALTERMLAGWQVGSVRDMKHDMHELTMHVANKTLFGLDTVEGNLGELIARWLAQIVNPLGRLLPYDLPGSPQRKLKRLSQELEKQISAVIARKRQQLGNDVLSTLLQTHDENGAALTDDEVLGQTNILFIAGHETSANTLTWALFMLAQHPRVLAAVREEIDGVLGGQAPTVEQLGQLQLLERVIKETLRLMPPLTWTLRTAQQPFEIGPYSMPAQTTVFYSHFMTHRLPELYEQPERFMPERWQTINPSPYEYIPFSGGPRLCIGATFAMMEMKIVLPMILQRFSLSLLPDAHIDYQVLPTLTVKKGLPMLVQPHGTRVEKVAVQGTVREMVMLA
ncbi:MAG: cytochrome P450 [Chloroflexi bacterium]|nr:cytochrome P450 [Chloroflexota bacterium]